MQITLVHVVLASAFVLAVCLLLPYLKLVIHILILLGKVVGLAVIAFILIYALGIWRPDLSPLLWLTSKVLTIIG